tara:strand:+ start:62 stop:850 length:789 start_codon:yes stop_codon:yes gene_type:complete
MKRLLKLFSQLILWCLGGALFTAFIGLSMYHNYTASLPVNFGKSGEISNLLLAGEKSTVRKSQKSAVQVASISADKMSLSTSSGTYIKLKGGFYILTVRHGINGPCEHTKVLVGKEFYPCKRYVASDARNDYMVMEVDEIPGRVAVEIPKKLINFKQWKQAFAIMNRVFYTGYPNRRGPFTFDGKIVGYSDRGMFVINSFAWGGSSGSGVFTHDGTLIGYVVALDIGVTEFGPDVLEDIVMVMPIFRVDWAAVKKAAQEGEK